MRFRDLYEHGQKPSYNPDSDRIWYNSSTGSALGLPIHKLTHVGALVRNPKRFGLSPEILRGYGVKSLRNIDDYDGRMLKAAMDQGWVRILWHHRRPDTESNVEGNRLSSIRKAVEWICNTYGCPKRLVIVVRTGTGDQDGDYHLLPDRDAIEFFIKKGTIPRDRMAPMMAAESIYLREVGYGEDDHAEAERETGYWGRAAAGSIVLAKDTGRIGFSLRSPYVLEPETYGSIGGAIDRNEDPKTAAAREMSEELGYHMTGRERLIELDVFRDKSFTYTLYLLIVPNEFRPTHFNWENTAFEWVEFGQWPQPLHPKLAGTLQKPDVLRKIQAVIEAIKTKNKEIRTTAGTESLNSQPRPRKQKLIPGKLRRNPNENS